MMSYEFLLFTVGIFLISCFFPDILLQEIDNMKKVEIRVRKNIFDFILNFIEKPPS